MSVRILVVDDEPSVAEVLITYLKKYLDAFEVISAENGEIAITRVLEMREKGELPDLTLMDLVMPVLNGIECTRQLTKIGVKDIYILTGHVDTALISQAEDVGAKGIIKKSEGYKTIAKRVAEMTRSLQTTNG